MKKIFALLLVLTLALSLAACGEKENGGTSGTNDMPGNSNKGGGKNAYSSAKVGDVVQFGKYNWRVLTIESGKMLLLTEDIIDFEGYNNKTETVTWETCDLRAYLNGDFLNDFTNEEKNAIIEITNKNVDNQRFGTDGGNDTKDKIFLLSLDEVNQYLSRKEDRVANYDEEPCNWWLRSSGEKSDRAAYVTKSGSVVENGISVACFDAGTQRSFGVRPLLWLNK